MTVERAAVWLRRNARPYVFPLVLWTLLVGWRGLILVVLIAALEATLRVHIGARRRSACRGRGEGGRR